MYEFNIFVIRLIVVLKYYMNKLVSSRILIKGFPDIIMSQCDGYSLIVLLRLEVLENVVKSYVEHAIVDGP